LVLILQWLYRFKAIHNNDNDDSNNQNNNDDNGINDGISVSNSKEHSSKEHSSKDLFCSSSIAQRLLDHSNISRESDGEMSLFPFEWCIY
jgi:hypothetical protein